MKKLFVAVGGLLALIALLAFARYETIAPCGMLRSEAKRLVLASLVTDIASKSDGASMLGYALGLSMLDPMLEAYTAPLGPGECLATLFRLRSNGSIPGDLSGRLMQQPNASQPTGPPPEPEWTFITTKDPITDELFSRAIVRTESESLSIYLTDNQLYAGLKSDRSASYDASELTMRVDTNPAFGAKIFNKEDAIYVTLTTAQVDQIAGGTELLVRYDAALGSSTLLRFPLRGASAALEQVGRPKPPPPPPPRPDYSKLTATERLAIWKRQYDPDGSSATSDYARSTYKNCESIVSHQEPIDRPDQLFRCVNNGFPLK